MTLLLYGPSDHARPRLRVPFDHLRNKSGRVWHCRVPAAQVRGRRATTPTRVDGPVGARQGQRFDPEKILLDPVRARRVLPAGASTAPPPMGPGSNAGRAPLGVLGPVAPSDGRADCRPRHAWDTVIYEMHVRGFTRRPNSGVAAERRGTFAGVIDKIPYLAELGVTAVELLPVFQRDPQEGNYWGYMPLNFFAPHYDYASAGTPEGAIEEMAPMVRALHDAGIEVILDVVYNHTVEGDETGPTYSYRGIDNSTYYLLRQERPNAVPERHRDGQRPAHRQPRRSQDGRREHAVLGAGRCTWTASGSTSPRSSRAAPTGRSTCDDPPMISAIDADPDFAGVRLIAEAWDLHSYQLGRRFPGVEWLQWNDRSATTCGRSCGATPGRVGRPR